MEKNKIKPEIMSPCDHAESCINKSIWPLWKGIVSSGGKMSSGATPQNKDIIYHEKTLCLYLLFIIFYYIFIVLSFLFKIYF